MTAVFDTNVLVAALVAKGLCHEAFQRAVRLRVLASSEPLMDELETVLRKKFVVTPATTALLTALRHQLRLVDPAPLPAPVCRDRDDDVVLATAVAADADVIVTGDQDLQVLVAYQRIPILNPRQFLEWLDAMAEAPEK
ncbi:MAG: putative toxin-antitoxin system toxin component, PIN family [Vicinamibacterales bacterium]